MLIPKSAVFLISLSISLPAAGALAAPQAAEEGASNPGLAKFLEVGGAEPSEQNVSVKTLMALSARLEEAGPRNAPAEVSADKAPAETAASVKTAAG